MNTLKKGDKCQSPWGVVEIIEINPEFATVETEYRLRIIIHIVKDHPLSGAKPQ